ncbi:MAG: alcohol dehydrogenase catalytic domain-containing protein [Anaerolineae bacterium]|jgi:threonine dehydrogenase-like Zn-dependent dehydrogenase|nr:alcohol dehydrogenase catalytic domain-containing protein [Anaerolineae bacterium]MDH7473582.1 alcohol dehydrogenase catalytic domain-containing protein [Anaerolineae bacterium]
MKALIYDGELRLVTDYPRPEPPPGEALVRVTLAGICNTDLEVVRGYMGFHGVLGHEFVGVVEDCGVPELVGQRVVGDINAACGNCPTCRAGRPTHCPQRTTLGIDRRDGAFAEFLTLPAVNLFPVPDQLSDREAVFAEPLAAACEILEQVHLHPTDRVVVLGDGKLGLLVAQVLSLTGCDLLVVGRHPQKLVILRQRGIPTALGDEVANVQADVVVDCTGHPDGFLAARAMVRPRGTLVLKSTFHGVNQVDLTSLVVDEVQLIGSRCGPFAPALRLLARKLIDVESLIDAVYPLDQALAAFERASTKGTLKILLEVE